MASLYTFWKFGFCRKLLDWNIKLNELLALSTCGCQAVSADNIMGSANFNTIFVFVGLILICPTHGFLEGLYCGMDNCYDCK